MTAQQLQDIADQLMLLDPVRTYPQRAAEVIASMVDASGFRLDLADGQSVGAEQDVDPKLSLPLRSGREVIGTLHLFADATFGDDAVRSARWGARLLARGVTYCTRLKHEGGRRAGEDVAETLERAPLTPRERDVVSLLVSGSSTRDIASRTGLTVSTVNTYLKRIFSKLGVHSRIELVARMAGTDGFSAQREANKASHAR